MSLWKNKIGIILGSLIILSFVSFCLYTIFELDNLEIASTESQNQIVITESDGYDVPTNNNHNTSNSNPTKSPFANPLLREECRKAILNNDNIEISTAISHTASLCEGFNGVYTREGLDAFKNGSCPFKFQSIRSHELVIKYLKANHNLRDNGIRGNHTNAFQDWFSHFPIYYMIPKAGSSTTHKVLSWSNKHSHLGRVVHERIGFDSFVKGSQCAFTLVRSPIARLISGYYTINVHLWRFLKGGFFHLHNDSFRKPSRVWKFMSVKYEPERFRTFVSELVSEPNRFTTSGGNEHVISASTLLAAFVGEYRQNDMTFIGKVENYPGDMYKIMRLCDYFNDRDIAMVQDDKRSHEMQGFGWHSPKSWVTEWELYGNWVEWMSLFPILYHWKATQSAEDILPPAYYAIDEALYEQIVSYYIQDIVCFDYKEEISFEGFKANRDSFLNIYEMYSNYSNMTAR